MEISCHQKGKSIPYPTQYVFTKRILEYYGSILIEGEDTTDTVGIVEDLSISMKKIPGF
jgi:hypothetical protein